MTNTDDSCEGQGQLCACGMRGSDGDGLIAAAAAAAAAAKQQQREAVPSTTFKGRWEGGGESERGKRVVQRSTMLSSRAVAGWQQHSSARAEKP